MSNSRIMQVVDLKKSNYDRNHLYRANVNFPMLESKASQQQNHLYIPTTYTHNCIIVKGWSLGAKFPVKQIEISYGQDLLAKTQVDISRPDVTQKFPDGKSNENSKCGFVISCRLPEHLSECELDVYALIDSDHQRVHFASLYVKQIDQLLENQTFNNFFIIFNSRCGSTYLIDILRNHPNIDAYMEQIYKYQSWEKQCDHINSLYGIRRTENIQAVGFKEQLVNIIEPQKTVGYMMENYSPKIFKMIRKNVVKTAISAIRAKQLKAKQGVTNVWNSNQNIESFSISYNQLMAAIKHREKINQTLDQFLEEMDLNYQTIVYEELLDSPQNVLKLIQKELNLDSPIPLNSSVQKNTSNNLKESISNFDDLVTAFAGTKYEEMLLEGVSTSEDIQNQECPSTLSEYQVASDDLDSP